MSFSGMTWLSFKDERIIGGADNLTRTPDGCRIARAKPRFEEIQAWRDNHPEHTGNFVILDDEPDFGPLHPYHVRTRSDTGLTELLVKEVIERLNKPHP